MQDRLPRLQPRLRSRASLAAAAALALPALAQASVHFTIGVHIANHTPIVGKRWPVELTVTDGRKKLSGSIKYEFLYSGVVVRTQPRQGAFAFTRGVYRDQLLFPQASVNEPLTLRFVVTTRYGTEYADWTIKTKS